MKGRLLLIAILVFLLSGCGTTEVPRENQILISCTTSVEPEIQEIEVAENEPSDAKLILTDNITYENFWEVTIPHDYYVGKVKAVDFDGENASLICLLEKGPTKVLTVNNTADNLENKIACVAMQLKTPQDFCFTIETSSKSYADFNWNVNDEIIPGDCATEDSIIMEELSDNEGYFQDENGFHLFVTFECGSIIFSADDLEKLKEVVSIMIG